MRRRRKCSYELYNFDTQDDFAGATDVLWDRLRGRQYHIDGMPTAACAEAAAGLFDMEKGSLAIDSKGAYCLLQIIHSSVWNAIHELAEGNRIPWSMLRDFAFDDPDKLPRLERQLRLLLEEIHEVQRIDLDTTKPGRT